MPRSEPLIALVALLVLVGLAFVVGHENAVTRWDARVVASIAHDRPAALTAVARTLTWFGNLLVLAPLALAAWVVARRARPAGGARLAPWLPALALTLAAVADPLLKALIGRPRPPAVLAAVVEHSTGYPSGHSAQSAATFLALALLAGALWAGHRRAWLALAVCGTVVVGLTRVVLAVHSPTDLLGGWSLGILCALGAAWIAGRRGAAGAVAPRPSAARGY